MNRLLSLIVCSSVILLTIPAIAEARPRREIRSFNSGVHHSFPSRSPTYNRSVRSCYNCRRSTPYHRGYQRGYYRGLEEGYRRRTYDRGYRGESGYPRNRTRSRIRIEYQGDF